MAYSLYINKNILCLTICLKSIRTDSKDSKLIRLSTVSQYNKNTKILCQLYRKCLPYCIQIIYIIFNILQQNINSKAKNKITFILKNYSNKNNYSQNTVKLISYKYVQKFVYHYKKHYRYSLIDHVNQQNHNSNNISIKSIIFLYLLYKILLTKKPIYIYNKVSSQVN